MTENEIFIDYFIKRHLVDRVIHADVFMRSRPWYFYLVTFVPLCLPWIATLRSSSASLMSRRLFAGWVIIPFIIFSLASSKLVLYVLPLCGGVALYAADVFPWKENRARTFVLFYGLLLVAFLFVPVVDRTITVPSAALLVVAAGLISLFVSGYFDLSTHHLIWISTSIFSVVVLIFSALVLRCNEVKFHGMKPVAEQINDLGLAARSIIVFDVFLPSLAFELDRPVITIHDQNDALLRETQFETNDHWKEFFVDLNMPSDSARLVHLQKKATVLVVKGPLPVTRAWLSASYRHHREISPWHLYF